MNNAARTDKRVGAGSRLFLWLLPSVLLPLALPAELRALAVFGYDALLFVAFALDALHLARARLVLVREAAPRPRAGEVSSYSLCLENRGPSAYHITLADDTGSALLLSPASFSGKLAGHAHWEAALRVRAEARGPLTLGPAYIHVESTLGLARIGRALGEPQQLTVLPAQRDAHGHEPRSVERGLGQIARGRFGGPRSEHLEGLRAYRAGDARRDVDTKASAKHGGPVVRTYRSEHDEPLWIVIDVSRTMLRTTDDATRHPYVDTAVSAAQALCERALGEGRRVGLLAFDVTLRAAVLPQQGTQQRARLLTALSPLAAAMQPLDSDALYYELTRHIRGSAEIALITALNADAQTAPLLRVLRPLLARHHLHCIAIGDLFLQPRDLQPLADDLALYTRAARLDLLEAERARWAELARAGVHVLHFGEGDHSLRSAQRYAGANP